MIISNEDVLHSIRCNSVSVWANLNASPSPGVHYDCSVPAESMYHWQLRMHAVLLLAAATAGSLASECACGGGVSPLEWSVKVGSASMEEDNPYPVHV